MRLSPGAPTRGSDENGMVRIDRWLWAARFFKSRTLATHACDLGRIEANGQRAKPAREVRAGDVLRIRTEGGHYEVEVLLLSDIRGPAAVAQTLYRETDAGRELRQAFVENRKAEGRPSKRDRREINRLRGR